MLRYILLVLLFIYNLFGYDLTVKVDNLRNSNGIVQFSLYNKDGSIPDEHFKHYIKQLKVKPINNKAQVTFKNLQKERYAVNVLHDENNNGKIDKGFVLPLEGVGFTNFDTINLFHKPNFKKASFELNKDTTKTIKVIYF